MRCTLFALSLFACSGTSTPAAVPPSRETPAANVVRIPSESEEPDESPAAPQDPEPSCKQVRYQIERIDMSSSTCTVDIPKVGTQAVLECTSGKANLHFDNRDYAGSLTGTEVELELVSTYDFTDGCLWEASAHITGAPGSPLRLDYTERTIRGADCSSSCTATAVLGVLP